MRPSSELVPHKSRRHLALGLVLAFAFAVPSAAQLTFSELMYNPASGSDGDEYVELINTGTTTLSIGDWCVDGLSFCFPPGTSLAADQRLLLVKSLTQFQTTYGATGDFEYAGALDDNGERLVILSDSASIIDEVVYSDRGDWPVTADGLGPSLEVRNLSQDNAVPQNWFSATGNPPYTPGAPNNVQASGTLPFVDEVTNTDRPGPGDETIVTTRLFLASGGATLYYVVDFGPEQQLPLLDNGQNGDGAAGDLTFGARIPPQPAGSLIRYRIEANNASGTWFYPRQDDTVDYDGTVVVDPATSTSLPILWWFMDQVAFDAAIEHKLTDDVEPSVIFFDGQLYDNTFTRVRGQSARFYPKTPWKHFFPQGHNFEAQGRIDRPVDNFNMQANYSDKAFVREILAWETVRDAGSPYQQVFPIRVHLNGEFFGLYNFLEDPDSDWVRRNQLSETAARYKAFLTGEPVPLADLPEFYEKQGREEEGYEDLFDFQQQLNALSGEALDDFLFDNIDIPEFVNYLAVKAIIHDNDHMRKNHFYYRDTDGTGRWTFHHWDLDLSFGRASIPGSGVLNDSLWADQDSIEGESSRAPSHPLAGDSEHQTAFGLWNRVIDRVLRQPQIQQMYFRRLRTLMDTLLAEGQYEKRIDELQTLIAPEALLDTQQSWGQFGDQQTLQEAIDIIKNEYLPRRRDHLFTTHSACDIPGTQTPNPGIVISELMFAPASDPDLEFVELFNPTEESVDITDWRIDGIAMTVKPGTVILPGGYALFVKSDVKFRQTYGSGNFIAGEYKGSLSDVGEAVDLKDSADQSVSSVSYDVAAPWPTGTTTGRSLELIDPAQSSGRIANWSASNEDGGTPGAANSVAGTIGDIPPIWINEIVTNNVSTISDEQGDFDPWIEIYNESGSPVDLSGVQLATNLAGSGGFPLPPGTVLCGNCWTIIWADGETGEGPLHTDFTLPGGAGEVGLFTSDGRLIDYVFYEALVTDRSWGRFPDAGANFRVIPTVTPGATNTVPTSPIVLNEYNAVSDFNLLGNGRSDPYWGRVQGNGGDWFELVVTEDNLDLRGWQITVSDDTGGANQELFDIVFTDNDRWSDLRAGSLFTVSDELATDLTYFPPGGDWWINANIPEVNVSNRNWQITVRDDQGVLRFGPVGEGINPVSGVGSDEVFKLEEDPTPFIDPELSNYNDGTSSTFGGPNVWAGGTEIQDFLTLREIGLTEPCSAPDSDSDGICDLEDNCTSVQNSSQFDSDSDGIGNACDTCPSDPANDSDGDGLCADNDNCDVVANASQTDSDGDGFGDPCDNCPDDANAGQLDTNSNGLGDVCDPCPTDLQPDFDSDGVCNSTDNCPNDANANQTDGDGDGAGDACDVCPGDALDDGDGDGLCADADNCPSLTNPSQADSDGDGIGDDCDNCPAVSNGSQTDADDDGFGDACDDDDDEDGLPDGSDNCPFDANPGQEDLDMNGVGDVCDGDADGDNVMNDVDNCPRGDNAD